MIKLTAPKGQRIKDTRTEQLYSEVICDEKYRERYVLTDGDAPKVSTIKAPVSLAERVADLENAVESIAAKSKVNISLKAKAGTVEKEVVKK